MKDSYEEFSKKGINLKVVLQSDPDKLKGILDRKPLPFEIITDPDQELYKRFEIEAASSKLKLAGGFKTIGKLNKAKKLGLEHGEYEGNELQLPALFIIDKSGTIEYAKYSKNLGDLPSAQELLQLLEE